MKKLLLTVFISSIFINAFSQVTFSQLPETPLSYLGYEITSPAVKSGYTKRTKYVGQAPYIIQTGLILQKKYADLPIYSFFKEITDAFSYLESKTTISRSASYAIYKVDIRDSDSGPYATYAVDTFFLSGTKITSISETIYDTESVSLVKDTYATYDVVYHSNGKIERIKLKSSYQNNSVFFAGVSVEYNTNNTLKTDSTFQFQYDGSGNKTTHPEIYQNHTYKSSNLLQPDSTFYYQIGANPILNTKFTYTLNANNEILKTTAHVYDADEKKYKSFYFYEFGEEPSLGVLSKSTVSTVSLYPNPVENLIHIPLDCPFQSWSIISITGESIKSGSNSDFNKISVADLHAGVYVVTLINNEQTWTGKFIK